jgi:hypothetical protein
MKQTFEEAAAELNAAWKTFILAFAHSLKLDKVADWLAKKLTKE